LRLSCALTNPDGDKENPVADPKFQPSMRLYVILARKASMGACSGVGRPSRPRPIEFHSAAYRLNGNRRSPLCTKPAVLAGLSSRDKRMRQAKRTGRAVSIVAAHLFVKNTFGLLIKFERAHPVIAIRSSVSV
jgi:hypothetical protein